MKNSNETKDEAPPVSTNDITVTITKNTEIQLKLEEKILIVDLKIQTLLNESYYSDEDSLQKQFKSFFNDKSYNIIEIYDQISQCIENKQIDYEKKKHKLILTLNIEKKIVTLSFHSLIDLYLSMNKKTKTNFIFLSIMFILVILLFILIAVIFEKINKIDNRTSGNQTNIPGNDNSLFDGDNDIKEINIKIEDLQKKIKEKNNLIDINIKNINDSLNERNNKINQDLVQINKAINLLETENKKNINDNFNFQLVNTNLKLINTFEKKITKVKQFPSGNILSVINNSLLISDYNFNDIQTIIYAHKTDIKSIDIFDDYNFVTCSNDDIRIWTKKDDKFKNSFTININNIIKQVFYDSKGNLISLSQDNEINIWKYYDDEYVAIKNITIDKVYSLFLLEDKNLLLSIGTEIIFWELNTFNKIKKINLNDVIENYKFVERISDDRIIIGRSVNASIISISQKEIIQDLSILSFSYNFMSINNKGIFFVTQFNDISIFRSDNFEMIQTIEKAHEDKIEDIICLKNGTIATITGNEVKLWSL